MTDLTDLLLRLVPAIAALISVLGGLALRTDPLRANLEKDAQILAVLPEGDAHRKLQKYIAERVDNLRAIDSGTRDWPSFAMALIFAPGTAYLAIWLWGLGHWWAYPLALVVGILSTAGFYGIFESLQKKDRNKAKDDTSQASKPVHKRGR